MKIPFRYSFDGYDYLVFWTDGETDRCDITDVCRTHSKNFCYIYSESRTEREIPFFGKICSVRKFTISHSKSREYLGTGSNSPY